MAFFWFSALVFVVLIGAAFSADRRAKFAGRDERWSPPAEPRLIEGGGEMSWDGRRVFNRATGEYLGRAVGEPHSPDGLGGVIALRQDEEGQVPRSYAVCDFVVLDEPPAASVSDSEAAPAQGPRAA